MRIVLSCNLLKITDAKLYLWRLLMIINWSFIWTVRLGRIVTSSKLCILRIYAVYALFIKYFCDRDLLQSVLGDLCQLARYGIMYEKHWINYLGLTSGQDDDVIKIAKNT